MGRGWRRITEAVRFIYDAKYLLLYLCPHLSLLVACPIRLTTYFLASSQVRQKIPIGEEFEATSNLRNEAMFKEVRYYWGMLSTKKPPLTVRNLFDPGFGFLAAAESNGEGYAGAREAGRRCVPMCQSERMALDVDMVPWGPQTILNRK